jgi:hypothetical protein
MKKIILVMFCCIFVTAVFAKKEGMSVVIIGDSNTEQGFLPRFLSDSLLAYVGSPASTGTGYIPIKSNFLELNNNLIPGVTISYQNTWTLMDMFEGTRLQKKPYLSPNGFWTVSSTVGAGASVTFPGNGVDVYWLSDTNGGKFSITIDNVAKDTLDTKGSRGVQKTIIRGLNSGSHTMLLKVISVPSSGNVTLLGFEGHNDIAGIAKRSVVHNWGNGYCASIDFVNIDSVIFTTGLQKLAPDVVAVLLGTNDDLQDNRNAADFETNMIVILNRIKAAGFEGKILLISTYTTHANGDHDELVPQYRTISLPGAAKATGVEYWDMSTWFGDNDAQYLYFDGCHCWDVCGKRIAPEFLRQLINRFPPSHLDSVAVVNILRANKLNLKVDAVSTRSASGRIVALTLDSLNISVLPSDIGNLDSLTTIDLTGNRLSSLPMEIVTLAPSTKLMVDNNRLCSVPDTIKNWISKYSKNTNWQNTQLSDSLHYCNGGPVVATAPSHKSVVAGSSGTTNAEVKRGHLTLSFVNPATIVAVKVMNLNGVTLHRFGRVTGDLSIDIRDLPKSVVVVRVERKGNGGDRTDVKLVPLINGY